MYKKKKLKTQIVEDINAKPSDNNEPIPRANSPVPNDIQIVKATSVTPKVSTNVFDESVKIIGDISMAMDGFGMFTTDKSTEVVKRFTLTNKNKMQVQIITLGATVTSIKLPDKNGSVEDVVLGFDSIEGEGIRFVYTQNTQNNF